MLEQKRACLIYVAATENCRESVRKDLAEKGFVVCEVKASIDDAKRAQDGRYDGLPKDLVGCIQSSNLCVFLLPEEATGDGLLGLAAGFAAEMKKAVIGIVAGGRADYPQQFQDNAHSMLRENSERIMEALDGVEIWEKPDRTIVDDRKIKHVVCQ